MARLKRKECDVPGDDEALAAILSGPRWWKRLELAMDAGRPLEPWQIDKAEQRFSSLCPEPFLQFREGLCEGFSDYVLEAWRGQYSAAARFHDYRGRGAIADRCRQIVAEADLEIAARKAAGNWKREWMEG